MKYVNWSFILISLIKKLLGPIQRSQLREMMRGYRILKKSGGLSRISLLKEDLTRTPLPFKSADFSTHIMGSGANFGEIVVRQYLLIRIGGHGLNKALLRSLGKKNESIAYPLPLEWQKIIQQHGFKVHRLKSSILWQLYIAGALVYGSLKMLSIFLSGLISIWSKSLKPQRYVYFSALTSGNLPPKKNNDRSFDVVSWYLQWKNKAKKIEAVCHSVPDSGVRKCDEVEINFQSEAIPPLGSIKGCLNFLCWSVYAILSAFFDYIRGQWWHLFLLKEAALCAQVRYKENNALALDYLFHNSGLIYRPLWTYEAERLGSRILFYFYSTNTENFKITDCAPSLPYGWKAITWSNYLVWDCWQEQNIRKAVGENISVEIVGPIWFNAGAQISFSNLKNTIAVFDVQPQRNSIYQILGISPEYYIPEVANAFLLDIHAAASHRNLNIYMKKKRHIGNKAHISYRQTLKQLIQQSNFYEIDADLSPWLLIEKSLCVISMPFTSTALIARHLGKPSIYYDPTGKLRNDDPAAHGITVLTSFIELNNWIQMISKSDA